MKNVVKIIALWAVIVFSMIACDNGSTNSDNGSTNSDNGAGDPTSATYTGYDAQGSAYTLRVVNQNPNKTALILPQSGDAYALTITSQTGTVLGTSTGVVKSVNGTTFTLENKNGEYTVTVNGSTIASISDSIPLDNSTKHPSPGTLTPNKPSSNGNEGGNSDGSPKEVISSTETYQYHSAGEDHFYSEYEYDSKGNLTKKNRYNKALLQLTPEYKYKSKYEYEYEYDSKGNLTKESHYGYDANGKLHTEDYYTYDEYEYDSKGNMTKKSRYQPKGGGEMFLYDEYEYEYDSKGNLTKASTYQSGKLDNYVVYVYVYKTI